jgi:hypothetical protein
VWFVLLVLLALDGCDRDPYRRTDVWQPTGSNAANIAAMAADQSDLIRGRGVTQSGTKGSTTAIERLWNDNPRPLGSPSGSGTSGSSGASGGGGGSGSSGGGDGGGLPSLSPGT